MINTQTEMNKTLEVRVPTGITFQKETLFRLGGRGDNWCITWAADDSQITSMDDGKWIKDDVDSSFHNRLYRIVGEAKGFSREELYEYPDFSTGNGSWFGFGIVSVDGVLYSVVSKTPKNHWSGPFKGVKIFKSEDNGKIWHRVGRGNSLRQINHLDEARYDINSKEMFFLEGFGRPHNERTAYPFSFFDFVQCGRDNSAAKDGYLYMHSPEGAHSELLMLARVPKEKLGDRSLWEYFTGYNKDQQPQWSADIQARQPVVTYPQKSKDGNYFGWYSWLPSVVWNEDLNLYIMVNGGTYAGRGMTDSDFDYYDRWMHEKTGSLGFWYSKNPYGPWYKFFYTDYWTADNPENLIYQPKLSPKWISNSGRDMVLIWSDAMKNEKGESHFKNYMWGQMTITLDLKE
jgi:hypothetical protein